MNHFIAKLIRNQHFQDFVGVSRGIFRVIDASIGNKSTKVNQKTLQTQLSNQPNSQVQQKKVQIKEKQTYQIELQRLRKIQSESQKKKVQFKSEIFTSHIPATSTHRAYQFSKLGLSLAGSAASSFLMQKLGLQQEKSYVLNEKNAKKITQVLCKMRGAPLKLAQALSIQQDKLIPKQIRIAFQKARQQAHVIPFQQINFMMEKSFGSGYVQKYFNEFSQIPFAASSIGQVHYGVLKNNKRVAVKIQYPNVKNSIDSDLINLKMLMNYTGIFPKTLFLQKIIENIRIQLFEECDYVVQKNKQKKFKELVKDQQKLYVPEIIQELSTQNVLTCQFVQGISMNDLENYSQQIRNQIGRRIMKLTFDQLFKYRFMQTDPNPSNFFYNIEQDKLNLIDFGATRQYSVNFIDYYFQVIKGSVIGDENLIWNASKKLGFVTGQQNMTMKSAHIQSIKIVGEPFKYEGEFDFGAEDMTQRIYKTMPLMLKNRLRPPPTEVYSLHRKLSGSYLMCIRLKSKINCNQIYNNIRKIYRIEKENEL